MLVEKAEEATQRMQHLEIDLARSRAGPGAAPVRPSGNSRSAEHRWQACTSSTREGVTAADATDTDISRLSLAERDRAELNRRTEPGAVSGSKR